MRIAQNVNIGMAQTLRYESELLVDTANDDSLFIHAKGLSYDRLLLLHLKVYCHPRTLVLVVNCMPDDQKFITDQLAGVTVDQQPETVAGNALERSVFIP